MADNNKKNILFKIIVFFIGTTIIAFGIGLVNKGNLGTAQLSSIPYVVSLKYTNLSFGFTTLIMNLVMLIAQLILLKKRFTIIHLLQLPATFIFSYMIDLSMLLLSGFNPVSIVERYASLLLGCVVMSYGIAIEVAPDYLTLPGEGIVIVLADVLKKPFGKVKAVFDVSNIIVGIFISFIFFGALNGIGIGTMISAVLVGHIVSFINKHSIFIKYINKKLQREQN